MKFPMIHTDAQGETHFGVRDIPDREVPFGPPPNPTGQMTDFGAVTSMFVFSVPAGTNVPAHNAPQPYICINLSGEGEVVTSDGEARLLPPRRCTFLRRPHRQGARDPSDHRHGRGVRQPDCCTRKLTR